MRTVKLGFIGGRAIAAMGAALAATALAACSGGSDEPGAAADAEPEATEEVLDNGELLDLVLAGAHRTEEERARDQYRNPKETLLFFGAEPGMRIVEIWPGGGWYANVIAPYLAAGGGEYYAAHFDPARSERAAAAVAAFKEKYEGDEELYGDVTVTRLGGDGEIAPAGSADMVLTFRNVHNWTSSGDAEAYFQAFYNALKPGGVLGVVEHRANEDADDGDGSSGYVKESTVIALAEAAGFDLDQRSDINANPADTKDHPFGVWTLPPVARSSLVRGEVDPDFDRAKYDAIGESDRMTLKFRKPVADGPLME